MADAGTIGTTYSGHGRCTDSGWWSAASPLAPWPAEPWKFTIPGWGWWTVPNPLSVLQSRRCLGTASLSGTVASSGSPVQRWVMICERRTMEVIAVTKSAANGTWAVSGLDNSSELYFAVALDSALNIVGLDRLTAA